MATFSRYYSYIEPIAKSPQAKGYTMFILSVFAIAFFGLFAIRPTILTIIGLQKEILQAREVDKKLALKIQALDQSQANWDALQGRSALLNQAVPTTPHIAQFMRLLENVAIQANVTLGALQVRTLPLPGEENPSATSSSPVLAAEDEAKVENPPAAAPPPPTAPPAPSVNEIKLTFTAEGTEPNIEAFLRGLYAKRRLTSVNNIHLLARDSGNIYVAEISLSTYTTP